MKLIQRGLVVGMRRALFGGCLLAASTGTAWAQQAGAAPADPASPATETEATTLDRIMVTAQSRDQELQDVPIALQVVGEDVIQTTMAQDIGDLDGFIPGLVVDDMQPTQASFRLRGLSTGDFGIGTDPTVGVYVDGVYAGRGGGTVLPFIDVERIEVLKGPQGTLFGRNTAAGAISIITKRPSLDRIEGRARLRLGNYDRRYFDGMLNLPVGDNVAFRINALHSETGGWLDDAATGKPLNDGESQALRAALSWNAGDNTQVLFSWDHERLDQRSRPSIGIVELPAAPGLPAFPVDPDDYRDPFGQPAYTDVVGNDEGRTFDGATLIVDHAFDWGHLTSTTAWRNFDTLNRAEEDGTNRRYLYIDTANLEDNTTWYQEFKFSGSSDRLDWVAGASYFQESAKQTSQVDLFSDSIDTAATYVFGLPIFSILQTIADGSNVPVQLFGHPWTEAYHNTLEAKAFAAFGDVIWHATDRLNLTFGLRYTRDQKDFTWLNGYHQAAELDRQLRVLEEAGILNLLGLDADFFAGTDLAFQDPISMANKGVLNRASQSWSDVSPRFVIDYHLSDDTMVFASLAKGYKAGGYNSFSPGAHFDNEEVWNFETGIKRSLVDERLQFEASAFRYKYDNRQAIRLDTTPEIPRYVTNVSDLTAWGMEFSARWFPTSAFSMDFNASWIDSTYDDYVTPEGLDLTGEATGEPLFSYSAGANYQVDLGNRGGLQFTLRHAYRGASRCNSGSSSQGNCGRYMNFSVGEEQNRTDVFVQWSSPMNAWGVALYANNVFDNRYVHGLSQYGTTVFGTTGATISEPRFYGVELRYQF